MEETETNFLAFENDACMNSPTKIQNSEIPTVVTEVYKTVTAVISDAVIQNCATDKHLFLEAIIHECQVQASVDLNNDEVRITGSLSSLILVHLRIGRMFNAKVRCDALEKYLRQFHQPSSKENKTVKEVVTQSGRVVKCNPNYVNYINRSQANNDDLDDDNDIEKPARRTRGRRGKTKNDVKKRARISSSSEGKLANDGTEMDTDINKLYVAVGEGAEKPADRNKTRYFYCDQCSYAATRAIHIEKHKLLHLKTTHVFQCRQCVFTTMRKGALRRHEVTHSTHKLKCAECAYVTDSTKELRRHHHLKHGDDAEPKSTQPPENCPHCSYVAKKKGQLARHMARHATFTYDCPLCPYKTSHRQHMRRHVTIVHSETRPFLCDYCGKAFKRKDSLELHKTNHADKATRQVFPCTDCPRSFCSKSALHAHLTIHSSQRAFLCDHCGSAFKTRAVQQKHIRTIHLNPYGLKCGMCLKRFSTRFAFKRHLATHEATTHAEALQQTTVAKLQIVNLPNHDLAYNPRYPADGSQLTQQITITPGDEHAVPNTEDITIVSSADMTRMPTITLHIQSAPTSDDGGLYLPSLGDADTPSLMVIPREEPIVMLDRMPPELRGKERLSRLQKNQLLQLQKNQLLQLQQDQLLRNLQNAHLNNALLCESLDDQQLSSITQQLSPDQFAQLTNNVIAATHQLQPLSLNLADIESVMLNQSLTLHQLHGKAAALNIASVPLSAIQTSLLSGLDPAQEVDSQDTEELRDQEDNSTAQLSDINLDSMLDRPPDSQTLSLYLPNNFQQM